MESVINRNNHIYSDILEIDDNKRYEIIDGEIYCMAAPSMIHQRLLMNISNKIYNYLEGKNCEVFVAPFDVFLDEKESSSKNVVEPDISVICDKNKITKKGCNGPPDLIVEIVSPNNKSYDYITKLNLYSIFKVREYLIVNPEKKTIMKYELKEVGFEDPTIYTFDDKVKISVLDGLELDLSGISLE